MKILSLDTAMAACSAAVIDTQGAVPLAAAFVPMERGHAEALPPLVAEVMKDSGVAFPQIDRIAVTTGPGTFTGVRIGIAFARGLGLAGNVPVIGIDTLSAIAANDPAKGPLLVVSDARNGEVYTASFDASRRLISAPHIATAAAAAADMPSETLVMGTAARAVIDASRRNDLILSQAGELPIAAHFAKLAIGLPPGMMPSPIYLRTPDATPQSSNLRKISTLAIEAVDSSASELLSALHSEILDEGWSAEAFADMLNTPGTDAAIARSGSEPLGFVITRSAVDEAEIIILGSRPSMQRRGVARHLLENHMAMLAGRGVRSLFLEVASSNAPAQALYTSCGFLEAGRRRGYYKRQDGLEDAIVMRRELHP